MDGVRKANYHEIGFQCRPGSPELNCCSVNAARGLGLIGEWAVMRDADGLFLNGYGPGTIAAALESGGTVKLIQETTYPLMGAVRIRVEPEKPGRFALRLRIPHWSSRTSVKVNGEPVTDVVPGRYLALSRAWKPGDVVDLELDMTPRYWAGERERRAGRRSTAARSCLPMTAGSTRSTRPSCRRWTRRTCPAGRRPIGSGRCRQCC